MSLGPSEVPQLEDEHPEDDDASVCCIAAVEVDVLRLSSEMRLPTVCSSLLAMDMCRATNMPPPVFTPGRDLLRHCAAIGGVRPIRLSELLQRSAPGCSTHDNGARAPRGSLLTAAEIAWLRSAARGRVGYRSEMKTARAECSGARLAFRRRLVRTS
jgi:hypothetical protein